jgi:beta-glucanase (GH16 family)
MAPPSGCPGSGGRGAIIVEPPDPLGVGALFFDNFAGSSIDTSKWTVVDRMSDQFNGELNGCLPANVVVSGSKLQITARHEDCFTGDRDLNPPHDLISPQTFHYTSGHIQQAIAPFLYGTVEARLKPPSGTGVWPCFWMLGENWQASQPYTADVAGQNWPVDGWCEVDIAEFFQGRRDVVNCTQHWQTAGGLFEPTLPYNATTRFMIYRLQWSAGSLIWSVDPEDGSGFQTLRTISGSVPNVPMYVVLNMAVGGNGGGTPNDPDFPMTMEVDWVRVKQP